MTAEKSDNDYLCTCKVQLIKLDNMVWPDHILIIWFYYIVQSCLMQLFFFNWTLSYKPINIISIIITPSSLCKIIYHYMKSNLFPIWKAPRSSWVLLEKTTTDKSEETKIKTEKKRVTSHSPALYLCRIYFLLYAFYCFDQPNCKCP